MDETKSALSANGVQDAGGALLPAARLDLKAYQAAPKILAADEVGSIASSADAQAVVDHFLPSQQHEFDGGGPVVKHVLEGFGKLLAEIVK